MMNRIGLIVGFSLLVNCINAAEPRVVNVSSVEELNESIETLHSNTEIVIHPGDYPLNTTLIIGGGVENITIRGTGSPDDVVICGKGMANEDYGAVPHGFMIQNATNVTLENLTIRDFYYHNVIAQGEQGASKVILRNLHSFEAGEQHLKVTVSPKRMYCDDGLVEDCLFAYEESPRSWYTNGVDVLGGANWVIRHNTFRNIRTQNTRQAGPAILCWQNCIDTLVEGNIIINCDFGIMLGNSAGPGPFARHGEKRFDHQGGIIRNNLIYRDEGITGDVGISVNKCPDFHIYNNTVILRDSFDWTIEARFDTSKGHVINNLTDGRIYARDGAQIQSKTNETEAQLDWFVNPEAGNFRLSADAKPVINVGTSLDKVKIDIEEHPRDDSPDLGAYEQRTSSIP